MHLTLSLARWSVTLSILAVAHLAAAATIYSDRTAYLAATATTGVATFEDVPEGSLAPFLSGDVSMAGVLVNENLANLPYSFWFGTIGSPTRFVTIGSSFNGFQAKFPANSKASGFIFNCFACDVGQNESALDWVTLDAVGNVIEQGSVTVNFYGSNGEPPPGFLGVVASIPFRTLRVARRSLVIPSSAGNWMVDDILYSAATAVIAPTNVPTLSGNMLLLTALALVALAFTQLCRRET